MNGYATLYMKVKVYERGTRFWSKVAYKKRAFFPPPPSPPLRDYLKGPMQDSQFVGVVRFVQNWARGLE